MFEKHVFPNGPLASDLVTSNRIMGHHVLFISYKFVKGFFGDDFFILCYFKLKLSGCL